MLDDSRIALDCKSRTITLKGECLDLLDICKGMCCRKWHVPIRHDEYCSNTYHATKVCVIDGNNCTGDRHQCINRQYRLTQKEDGSCVYQNEDNTCSIYDRRPLVCRNFNCKNGWEISSTCPPPPPKDGTVKEVHKTYETPLDGNMTFLANPLARLKTLFYAKDKKQVSFVVKPIDKCTYTSCSIEFDNPAMDDDSLRYLITLCDGKTTITAACAALNMKFDLHLSVDDVCHIARLLYPRGILVLQNEEQTKPLS